MAAELELETARERWADLPAWVRRQVIGAMKAQRDKLVAVGYTDMAEGFDLAIRELDEVAS